VFCSNHRYISLGLRDIEDVSSLASMMLCSLLMATSYAVRWVGRQSRGFLLVLYSTNSSETHRA